MILIGFWLGGASVASAQPVETVVFQVGQVSLAWDAPAFTTANAPDRYVATCTSSGGSVLSATVPHPTLTVSLALLVNGQDRYTCTVRAENAGGASPESAPVVAVIGGPPSVPVNPRFEGR